MDSSSPLAHAIYYGWPYAGLVLAALLLGVLFLRPSAEGEPYTARFRDPRWLLWAAVPMYLLHQFEEHGIDLLGRRYHFLTGLCDTLGHHDLRTCPGDPSFILAVNVSLTWFAGPLSATLARQRLYLGATFLCTPLINAFAHLVPALRSGHYNPGLATSVALFLPVCLYTLHLLRRQKLLDTPRLLSIPLLGIALHGTLLFSLRATEAGLLSHTARDLLQVLNAFSPLAVALALDKLLGAKPEEA